MEFKKMIDSVIQGDCLNIMKDIPTQRIDMILCDLPYGTTQNKWDSIIPLSDYIVINGQAMDYDTYLIYSYKNNVKFSDATKYWNKNKNDGLWSVYKRIIKPVGVIVLTSNELFTSQLISTNPKMFKYRWVWEKSKATNFLNAKKQPLRKFEDVCVFYNKQCVYNPQMTEGEAYDKGVRKNQLTGSYGDFQPAHVHSDGKRYPTDIVYFKTAESEGPVFHATQKPVELGRYFVKTYTNEGDIVLDNTCGSGSFLVAAALEKRHYIGIEKNEQVEAFKNGSIDCIEICKNRIASALKENK